MSVVQTNPQLLPKGIYVTNPLLRVEIGRHEPILPRWWLFLRASLLDTFQLLLIDHWQVSRSRNPGRFFAKHCRRSEPTASLHIDPNSLRRKETQLSRQYLNKTLFLWIKLTVKDYLRTTYKISVGFFTFRNIILKYFLQILRLVDGQKALNCLDSNYV